MAQHRFRERLRARERLLGTFVKTASYHVVEVLSTTGLDFVVIDAEHAPFDRQQLDVSILAARAQGLTALVRLPNRAPDAVMNVLDIGSAGVMIPHVCSGADAHEVSARAHYKGGHRGYSNSPRAGGYGLSKMSDMIEQADREVSVVCQIEDRAAVERVEEIAAVDEIDCLFIGRADLAVSYETFEIDHPRISDAVHRVCAACVAAGKAVGIFVGDWAEIRRYEDLGASLFVVGSDQSMLRSHAASLVKRFALTGSAPPPA